MWKPFIYGFVHVDSRCGHVLISCFEHNVQFGLWCAIGHKMFSHGSSCIGSINFSVRIIDSFNTSLC